MKYSLACHACGSSYNEDYPSQICNKCERNLEVLYKGRPRFKGRHGHFWDYESLLPSGKYNHYEVGSTKMVRSHESDSTFLKLEIENPTNSFKDRGSIIEVSKAVEYGYSSIACASTGNMAFSLSYFSELMGIKATIFISKDANRDKLRDIREVRGARIERVDGDFNKAMKLAYAYSKKNQAFLTGDYCYRKEGQRTLAYEIMDQLPSATLILIPVGNATLISGVYKALKELKEAKKIKRLPRLVAVQSSRCSPLITAFRHRKRIVYERPRTVADAIAVGYPTFGDQALKALSETHGSGVTVSDAELMREQLLFHKEYGLVAEPSGVAAIAALRKITLSKDDVAAAIISGGNV